MLPYQNRELKLGSSCLCVNLSWLPSPSTTLLPPAGDMCTPWIFTAG